RVDRVRPAAAVSQQPAAPALILSHPSLQHQPATVGMWKSRTRFSRLGPRKRLRFRTDRCGLECIYLCADHVLGCLIRTPMCRQRDLLVAWLRIGFAVKK
ncbi:hypothetical protein BaRGS_00038882, partial [Batillaria attramentaria]